MSDLDKAIEAAIKRQKEGIEPSVIQRRTAIASQADDPKPVDPYSPEAILRGANEDDDLYDPYSDYMDLMARSSYEEPCEDPWR